MKAEQTSSGQWWEIPNRPPAERRREFKALRELLRFFELRGNPWQVGAAGFEARVSIREPGLRGVVVYKVHLIGWEEKRVRCHASVTVWPRAVRATASQITRHASQAWREACLKALARHGYKGRWHRGKWHFGDFWKVLYGLRALRAEIRKHERWVGEPPWRDAVEQPDAADEARASSAVRRGPRS